MTNRTSPSRFRPALLLLLAGAALSAPPAADAQAVTTVTVSNPGPGGRAVPLTFGQIFKPGDIPSGKGVAVSGPGVSYQIDAKANHADGSLRHAVITVIFDTLSAGQAATLTLSAGDKASGDPLAVSGLLATDFDSKLTATLGGTAYSASAKALLQAGAPKPWLAGPLVTEWVVSAPLKSDAGAAHPHLAAQFAVRAYKGFGRVRVDAVLENVWAYEPSPQGFTYDASLTVGSAEAYAKAGLQHTHHARWRRIAWHGTKADLDWGYDRQYLLSTGAFPYYDKRVAVSAAEVAKMAADFEPMTIGNINEAMPNTGAQDGIGPLPRWAAMYLLTMDNRARRNVLANGACGGSYQIHYRDKNTGLPVSLIDYPYCSLLGNPTDTRNPKTGLQEIFPTVANGLDNRKQPDDAHQPSIAYLPYLISGDWFQLEELQFWANWNMIMAHPSYRQQEKGLLKWGQVRAQAWGIRTLGQAAYITPDDHPFKKYFTDRVSTNMAWYNAEYSNNPQANKLGLIGPTSQRPWMDDFFTWSAGYLVQLGFEDAKPLIDYKSKYVIGRMTEPFCWLHAPQYEDIRINPATSEIWPDFASYYAANFPNATCTGLKMNGYPSEGTGYGANLQPAIAAAVDAGFPGAQAAWNRYETRDPKQDYSIAPQFAVVPKTVSLTVGARARPETPARPSAGRRLSPVLAGSTVEYLLDRPSDVWLEVYDSAGKMVQTLSLGAQAAGRRRATLPADGRDRLSVGILYVRVRAVDDFQAVRYPAVTARPER